MPIWAKENTSTARYQSFSVPYAMCRLLSMRSNSWRMKANSVINATTRSLPARLYIPGWKRGNVQNVMTHTNHPTSSCYAVRDRESFLKYQDCQCTPLLVIFHFQFNIVWKYVDPRKPLKPDLFWLLCTFRFRGTYPHLLCSTALWSIKPFGAFVAHCWQVMWI